MLSSKPSGPVVAVEGRICAFGECVKDSLLKAYSPRYARPAMFVHPSYANEVLDLRLVSTGGVRFEHATHCPAKEFNSPDPNGTVRVAVATVYERNQCILLTQRHAALRSFPNLWVVPGGHIEAGETLHETARRELCEETGLCKDVIIADFLGIWESTFPQRASLGKMTHHHAVCYMSAHGCPEQELNVQTAEVQSIAWLNRAQVKAVLEQNSETSINVYETLPTQPAATLPSSREAATGNEWHSERSTVSASGSSHSAKSISDNMTAGTRFALTLWLERAPETKL